MKKCLTLIRDHKRVYDDAEARRSSFLYEEVVRPAAERLGFVCENVDPHDYGINDSRLFNLIASSDIMIVDASAKSMDYLYSLGVRHALTDKPTIVLVETDYVPIDVSIPRGVIHLTKELLSHPWDIRQRIENELAELAESSDIAPYSPVLTALQQQPRVFLSYAHADAESVLAVDQWLRNRGARVDLDERNFVAGRDIRDEIVRHVRRAGKVVCFFSQSSADRYYPKLERRLTEELERELHGEGKQSTILLYFRLDETPLPSESAHRLAINAWRMGFDKACRELWRNILEKESEPRPIPLAKYREHAPWKQSEGDEES